MDATRPPLPKPTPFELWARDRQRDTVVVKRATRGDVGAATGFGRADLVGPRKVLAVQFADGSVFFTDPVEYAQRYGQVKASRSAGGDETHQVVLPFEIGHTGSAQRSGGAAPVRTPIDRYTISELTEPTTLDRIYDFTVSLGGFISRWTGGIGGGKKPGQLEATVAAKLCSAFESATLHASVGNNGGALLHWTDAGWQPLPAGGLQWTAGAPRHALLFLHGTASSTEGSFGKLWAARPAVTDEDRRDDQLGAAELAADPAARQRLQRRRPADWEQLAQGPRAILAWDHRSFTRSPVDNTIELAAALGAALPPDTQLDMVSHSRGGLVGELLSLRTLLHGSAAAGVRERFVAAFESHPEAQQTDVLLQALQALALKPGRFVRVACPARGTLLADRRTDLYLALLLRSIQLALGGLGTFWYDHFAGLVKALVAERADAATLPGLEAMIPGSALTRALDRCRALAGAGATDQLRVIAGDTEDKGWGGVLSLLGDVFFGLHDHDFVVHTLSMFGGLRRTEPALSLRLAGASVTHFGYFEAKTLSRTALLTALAGSDDGFTPIDKDEARTRGLFQAFKSDPLTRELICIDAVDFSPDRPPKSFREPGAERKPVLLLLPGIMGSELGPARGETPAWLSMGGLLGGGLTRLELGAYDPSRGRYAAELSATGLMALSYENLMVAAQESFNVLGFAFDWRQPIADSGARLQALLVQLDRWAAVRGLPVHVVAHSMGGLVARQALFNSGSAGDALWQGLKQRGSRLLMLGTPNKGSYAPAQLLLRQHGLTSTLAKAARKVGDDDLARYGAHFEGLLAMLPQTADPAFGDLFEATAWRKVQAADSQTTLPAAEALGNVARFVRGFADSYERLCADHNVLYVAGTGDTVVHMRPAANPWQQLPGDSGAAPAAGVEFVTELAGDGTVPWTSTLRPERTWYAPCEHGTLADHKSSFAAYFELLRAGRTQRLPQQQPVKRGSGPTERVWRAPAAPLLPATDAALQALFFGRDIERRDGDLPALDPIQVRVVHGGLDYARFPLLVGHYQDEAPSGASKRVDEKLGGQLQLAIDLRLFSGAVRTAHYLRPSVRDEHAPDYPGAILLGLGQVGELTPGVLAETVTRGVLRYAFEHVTRDPFVSLQGPIDLFLSAVLVGTHVQAVTVRDSLAGLLYGAWRAAQLLQQSRFRWRSEGVRIREIEIIEIEETIALDAAYEMRRLLKRPEWQERVRWSPELLEERAGGLRGYRPGRSDSIWQRLVIKNEALGGLSFELIGERARVEATRVQSDVDSLTKFVDRICDGKALGTDRISDPADPRLGGVLFQMLLPIELKDRLANLDNTVLVVNDRTARYPWELLSPPLRGREDGDQPRPFAVHAGMVRQRTAEDFRRIPQMPTDFDALIVGAPSTAGWVDALRKPLRFSDLQGARLEAEAVRDLLANDGRAWRQTVLLGEATTFEQVRFALLEKPYRLIHLCGHGVVDQWVSRIGEGGDARDVCKTGMVLSEQQVLTAADVEQLNPVPDVVFINCCYSGRDAEHDVTLAGRSYPKLASSLALSFIKMGARAVVAAGWQVEDNAALLFAQTFYGQLLDGVNFGEAVRSARETVHSQTGMQSNTWGAYQCYGDPAWTLALHNKALPTVPGGTSRLRDAHLCMTATEFAGRILQMTSIAGDKQTATLLAQLDALLVQIRADDQRKTWLDESSVRAALAQAYRELGDHRAAAHWYQLGARRAYSEVQIGQLEQLINAMASATGTDIEPARLAAEGILQRLDSIAGETQLSWPLTPPEHGQSTASSERRCLEGGLVLSRAATLQGTAAAAEVQWAARLFAISYRQKLVRREDAHKRTYALSNAMLAAALAALAGGSRDLAIDVLGFAPLEDREEVDALMLQDPAELRDMANLALPADVTMWQREAAVLLDELGTGSNAATFWHHCNRLEIIAASTLLGRVLDPRAPLDGFDVVLPLLKKAMVLWPSPVERNSLALRFELARQLAPANSGDARLDSKLAQLIDESLEVIARPISP